MSSITNPPAKILLTSSTKISLHDRFTTLAKVRPQVNNTNELVVQPKASAGPASTKNRKLALQMANRPSVQAALKLKKKSIRQRLGNAARNQAVGNVAAVKKRISSAPRTGIDPSRLSVGGVSFFKKASLAQRLSRNVNAINKGRRYANPVPGNQPIKRVGNGGRIGNRNRFQKRMGNPQKQQQQQQARNPRLGNRRNQFNKNKGKRNGGGGAAAAGQPQQTKTREGLDMDLEQYMAKSKTHLDADLDVYMSQSNAQ